MKWTITALLTIYLLAIIASAIDLHCGVASAGNNTLVVACSAGRL